MDIISLSPILNIILVLGSLGMIMGSVLAIYQKHIKKIIAYSSVAQLGYIFFSIGLGTKLGIIMCIYHIIGHAVTKAALFLCSGAIMENMGEKDVTKLKGAGKEMPYTFAMFFTASLSMIGIPVFPGFISKWYMALATIEVGKPTLIILLLASSLLNAVYYLPITINGFFAKDNLADKIYKSKEKSKKELIPISILIAAVLFTGIASDSIIELISAGLV